MVAPFSDGRVSRSMVRVPGSGTDDDAVPICLNLGIVSNLAAMIPVPQTLQVSGRNGRQQIKLGGSCSVPAKLGETVPQGVVADDGAGLGYPPSANSPRLASNGIHARQMASGTVSPMLPPNCSTASRSTLQLHSSAQKRPHPDGVTGEANASMMSKRSRISSKSLVVGMNGAQLNNSQVNDVIPPGTNINNLKGIPFPVLPAAPGVIPLVAGQLQSQSSPGTGNAILSQAIPVNASPVTVTPEGIKLSGPFVLVPVEAIPLSLLEGQENMMRVVEDRNRLMKENLALKYRLARFHQLVRNKEKLMTVLNNMDKAVRA